MNLLKLLLKLYRSILNFLIFRKSSKPFPGTDIRMNSIWNTASSPGYSTLSLLNWSKSRRLPDGKGPQNYLIWLIEITGVLSKKKTNFVSFTGDGGQRLTAFKALKSHHILVALCYKLSWVSPKFLCWGPHLQDIRVWLSGDMIFKEVIKLKQGHLGGPWSNMAGVLIKWGNLDTQREDHMKTQGKDGHPRASEEINPAITMILVF